MGWSLISEVNRWPSEWSLSFYFWYYWKKQKKTNKRFVKTPYVMSQFTGLTETDWKNMARFFKGKQNRSIFGTHSHPFLTHHFLFRAQHSQLPEAHMEWWALVGAISLADNHNIDAARQRGLIDAFVQFFDGHQHLTCQLAHVVHGVSLKEGKQIVSLADAKTGEGCIIQRRSFWPSQDVESNRFFRSIGFFSTRFPLNTQSIINLLSFLWGIFSWTVLASN